MLHVRKKNDSIYLLVRILSWEARKKSKSDLHYGYHHPNSQCNCKKTIHFTLLILYVSKYVFPGQLILQQTYHVLRNVAFRYRVYYYYIRRWYLFLSSFPNVTRLFKLCKVPWNNDHTMVLRYQIQIIILQIRNGVTNSPKFYDHANTGGKFDAKLGATKFSSNRLENRPV